MWRADLTDASVLATAVAHLRTSGVAAEQLVASQQVPDPPAPARVALRRALASGWVDQTAKRALSLATLKQRDADRGAEGGNG